MRYETRSLVFGNFHIELANFTTPFDAETIKYLRSFLRKIKVFEEHRVT